MAIEYYEMSTNRISTEKHYSILENEIEVGYVTAQSNNNVLISTINIFPQFQGRGFGCEAFKKVYHEINEINEISTVRGVWCADEEYNHCENGMSTNLNVFLHLRENKSDEESAFLTPTGKWVSKLGFNIVTIISVSASEVIADFSKKIKPNPN